MSFANASATKRQLTIKTGVVKRLAKEETSYLREAEEQQTRIASFIDAGRDEYEIKQQKKVLQDCVKMVPDCRRRLEAAVDELRNYLDGLEDDPEVKETEEFTEAKTILDSVRGQLESELPSL